jgi:hypothetical protein
LAHERHLLFTSHSLRVGVFSFQLLSELLDGLFKLGLHDIISIDALEEEVSLLGKLFFEFIVFQNLGLLGIDVIRSDFLEISDE